MSKFSLKTKGLFTMALMAMLAVGCSSPKYYVFKTIKHTPSEKSEKEKEGIAENGNIAELTKNQNQEGIALVSTELMVEQVNLEKISQDISEKSSPNKQEKISKLEQITTALQVKKEIRKIEKSLDKEKAYSQDVPVQEKPKSQLVALLLAFFVGALGIHRFYLGYTTIGIIQLLTLGGCGIWALIDFIRIIIGDLKPADGSDYEPEL